MLLLMHMIEPATSIMSDVLLLGDDRDRHGEDDDQHDTNDEGVKIEKEIDLN
jgi:hypothetical protein